MRSTPVTPRLWCWAWGASVAAPTSDSFDTGGLSVIGVDNDHLVVEELKREEFNVLEGDATDHEFWHRLVVGGTARTVILAMAIHDSNTFALEQLRIAGFDGAIAAVVQRQDQADALITSRSSYCR